MAVKQEQPKKRPAIIKAFDLILTFDSNLSDLELEKETFRLIELINSIIGDNVDKIPELPQIEFDNQKGKKKIKIGVLPVEQKADE